MSETVRDIADARQAFAAGDLESALRIAAQMLAADPAHVDALEIKAMVETERGALPDAEATLRAAIAAAPDRRWPYADLTRLLLKAGRPADAEALAREAVQADPANPDAHAMLASLLARREQWAEASAEFERAIALAGPDPQLLTGLGQALLRHGQLAKARAPLEAAVEAQRDALEPLAYLAELEERLGRFEQSAALLDRAAPIARARGTDVDLQRSVLLTRMGQHQAALALLENRTDLSGAARLQRGRLLDRLGRHSEAWADWVGGKADLAERHGRHYPAQAVADLARRLTAFFSASSAAALPRAAVRGGVPQPLFIIGFPRSGTTLTEQILAAHGAIEAGGELPFGPDLADLAGRWLGGPGAFPEALGRLAAEERERLAARLRDFYLGRAKAWGLLGTGAHYVTDKMPTNAFWLPLLRMAFPHSPVVLVRRHPLDTLVSAISHDMTHGFHCAYRPDDAARHLALTDALTQSYRAAGWGPTHQLRYESLIADQAGETARLMAAIGLPVEDAQRRFHERASVSPTPSYAQVREPLNDRSVGRWRHFGRELEPLRGIVAQAMRGGAYSG